MNKITLKNIQQPSYLMREALNQLKSNIEFSGDDIKIVLMTSCGPDEGKSYVAFELARSLADEGKKVCYVDADLRKSVFNSRYQVHTEEPLVGLSSILSKNPDTSSSICETNIDNLHALPAGRACPDPTALFKGKRMDELMKLLRDRYDYAIIDVAPLGTVIDAAILAPKCDGTLLVVANNETSARVAKKVKNQLEMSGGRILGAVFNKARIKSKKYYYYYGQ